MAAVLSVGDAPPMANVALAVNAPTVRARLPALSTPNVAKTRHVLKVFATRVVKRMLIVERACAGAEFV